MFDEISSYLNLHVNGMMLGCCRSSLAVIGDIVARFQGTWFDLSMKCFDNKNQEGCFAKFKRMAHRNSNDVTT